MRGNSGHVTSYIYDDADRLTAVTDVASNVYDALNRMTQKNYPDSISPALGTSGAWPVTITGTGFGAVQSNSVVYFWGDVPAQIIRWSDTSIDAVVPNGASTGPVSVKVGGFTSYGGSFNVQNILQLTDSLSNQSSYTSAISGGKWALTDAQGPGCKSCSSRGDLQNTVDGNGNILTTTDTLGHTTTYTFDANSNVTSSSQQLDANTAAATSYTYNSPAADRDVSSK